MRQHTNARLRLGLMLGGVAIATVAAVATTTTAESAYATTVSPVAACSVTVADSAPVSRDPIMVKASLSSAIGDSITATVQAESNVSVLKVDPAPGGMENALQVTLNTSNGAPGDWTLSFKGTTGECSGKLKVTASP